MNSLIKHLGQNDAGSIENRSGLVLSGRNSANGEKMFWRHSHIIYVLSGRYILCVGIKLFGTGSTSMSSCIGIGPWARHCFCSIPEERPRMYTFGSIRQQSKPNGLECRNADVHDLFGVDAKGVRLKPLITKEWFAVHSYLKWFTNRVSSGRWNLNC